MPDVSQTSCGSQSRLFQSHPLTPNCHSSYTSFACQNRSLLDQNTPNYLTFSILMLFIMLHEYVQIRSNCLIIYELSEYPNKRSKNALSNQITYTGIVTSGSKKRMLTALDLLVQRAPIQHVYSDTLDSFFKFRLNFVTLTLTNSAHTVSASEASKSLLEPWLRYFRRKFNMKDYLWKAELQQNGQIHYHLATRTYLPHRYVRWKWNNLAKKEGLLVEYVKQYGNYNPPSTEVKSILSVRDAKSYIAKEFAKKQQNKISVKGKVWDCSDTLKRGYFSDMLDNNTFFKLSKGINEAKVKMIMLDKCKVFVTSEPYKYISSTLSQKYFHHIN